MELTSAPLHKGQVPWRGLLLTVSLLTYWNSPIAAQDFTLEAVPPNVAVGNNVLLVAHSVPPHISIFNWFRVFSGDMKLIVASYSRDLNSTKINRAYRGKMTMNDDKSLLIRDVSKDDAGEYGTVLGFNNKTEKIQSVELHVYYPVTIPFIQVNQTIDKDLVSVFLNCPSMDINNSIHWFFKGQSLRITNRMRLIENNSTLEIFPARREDSGNYKCAVSNPLGSKKSDPIQLDIIGE
ncbi:carcinoembryonic antigen-related cell adhesion molecule 1-like [Onychomys torridus]|uniref:carcinoembryonic antigen-related cell adhesion molecule 1-like n=1 Tax=Onychomys torridus TaxID=38674 RepID=UPI00167F429B|nr:carcinoembryonic antigen-related cell adhesion molecule 1-like [Onychomys torridus]